MHEKKEALIILKVNRFSIFSVLKVIFVCSIHRLSALSFKPSMLIP